jgi:exodeoxyribonuclease (lambda-induced)|nr:MAG TPA: Exonuclease [Caudoviricetes sp.]
MNGQNIYQNTPEWYNSRLYHFTSSELYRLMKKPKTGDIAEAAKTYILEKLAEDITRGTCIDYTDQGSRATRWGHIYEPDARAAYEERTGSTVDLCGFIEWSRTFGGSPDGLVGEDGIIEIKCPYNTTEHTRHLLLETAAELHGIKPEYYTQIQGNLLVTGRKWCDFISYDPRCQNRYFMLKILRVNRDEEFLKKIRAAIDVADRVKEQIADRMVRICMS